MYTESYLSVIEKKLVKVAEKAHWWLTQCLKGSFPIPTNSNLSINTIERLFSRNGKYNVFRDTGSLQMEAFGKNKSPKVGTFQKFVVPLQVQVFFK